MLMKDQYAFAKKDEMILGVIAILLISGLVYKGVSSLWQDKIHAVFRQEKKHTIIIKG